METAPTLPTRNARVDVADALRALAVMAIIVLHTMEHYNFYSYPSTENQPLWLNFTDRALWDGLFFLIGGKAYAIFALLFGFSFYIQYDNEQRRGRDFRLRFCWRMCMLFLIGQLDAAFFTAEILVLYAIVGLVLPLVARLSDRKVFVIACVCLLQPVCLYQIFAALLAPDCCLPPIGEGPYWAATYAAQSGAGFWDMLKTNLWEGQLVSLAWAWNNGRVFQTAALFMLGMLVGRRKLFLEAQLPLWGKIAGGALIAFFPLYGLAGMLPDFVSDPQLRTPLLLLVSSLHKFSFMLLLVAGVLYAYYRTSWRGALRKTMPYGRMSLTNYVTQGMAGSLLFYNWGFDLDQHLGITASVGLGIVLLAVQFTFCHYWMKSHRHGPLEYVWKRLTWIGSDRNRPQPTRETAA
ncbi:MAG: DUF418 domain-containing protein [Bacteroidaceae bacterium]|jgi:uncharacterized protein